jgi:hypothetical protein
LWGRAPALRWPLRSPDGAAREGRLLAPVALRAGPPTLLAASGNARSPAAAAAR